MSAHHHPNVVLKAILMKSQPDGSCVDMAVPLSEQQDVIVPGWLTEGLQKLFAEVEGESLPENFVILFRHLNEAEDT